MIFTFIRTQKTQSQNIIFLNVHKGTKKKEREIQQNPYQIPSLEKRKIQTGRQREKSQKGYYLCFSTKGP